LQELRRFILVDILSRTTAESMSKLKIFASSSSRPAFQQMGVADRECKPFLEKIELFKNSS
jgi:hypothetical protein